MLTESFSISFFSEPTCLPDSVVFWSPEVVLLFFKVSFASLLVGVVSHSNRDIQSLLFSMNIRHGDAPVSLLSHEWFSFFIKVPFEFINFP